MNILSRIKAPLAGSKAAELSRKEKDDASREASDGQVSPNPDCAIWHDIARALDIKPKGAK